MIDSAKLDGPLEHEDIRNFLRRVTEDLHLQLDSRVSMGDLSTPDGYRKFLTMNLRALVPLEEALVKSGVCEMLSDWPERSRVQALRTDLDALGVKEEFEPSVVDEFASTNEMLGILYVLEGSKFGNAAIRHELLKLRPEFPMAFLSHGADRALWKSFLPILNAATGSSKEIACGSRFAFEHFLNVWRPERATN